MKSPHQAFRYLPVAVAGMLAILLVACGGAEARKARHIEKGQEFLTARNYDKARIEFRNALQIDPDSAQIRYLTGLATEQSGNIREAAILYQGAIDIDEAQSGARSRLARLYALAGMNDRALALVEDQLKKQPDQPDLLAARAAAEMREGHADDALTDAQRAVALAPDHDEAIAVLAAAYQKAARAPDAVALLRKSIAAKPQSVDLRIILAEVLFAADRKTDAEAPLREAIALDPGRLAHRYRLAQVQRVNGHIADAETTLRDAIAAKPDSIEAKLELANFIAGVQSVDAADRELSAMVARSPKNLDLRVAEGDFCETHGRPERAAQIYAAIIEADGVGRRGLTARDRLATAALQAKHSEAAQKLASEVLAQNPHDTAALGIRAEIALQHGDGNAAILDLRTLLRDEPDSASLQRALARAYVLDKNQALAEEALRNVVQAHPADTAARVDLTNLLLGEKRDDEARAVMTDLMSVQPNAPLELYLPTLVRLELAQGDISKALAAVDKVIAANPDSAYAYNLRGQLQQTAGRTSDAEASFKQAISKAPRWWPSYQGLAVAQEKAGHIDDAIRQYETLHREDPTSDVAANNLAMLLVTYRTDKESLDRAASLTQMFARSDNPIFLDTYGWVLLKQGQTEAAIAPLEQAVRSVPDAPSMRYHLGRAQWAAGRRSAAHENLVAAVRSGVQFKGIDDAQSLLASTEK